MSPITNSLITFMILSGGVIFGMFLRKVVPGHHLRDDSRDVVKLASGLVGTMGALVLGLLVASAKGSFDAQTKELTQMSANVIVLDRILARYGPETKDARASLRNVAKQKCCISRGQRNVSGPPGWIQLA